ncbi:restriction endonuclease fold toxin-2 domain-containing protein [Actinomyces oris]|uniref:restriction endonuclease fold toxin-2 domain-containing protein n=1 Tax=Actinomyces oris TaxID=544580 RepID=UPI0026EBFBD2|nr:restriction endonuclease fold toxin-2 domain-containing protein [Actinomyces oris]
MVEEVLKLTPLAVLALAAPGRVRRFLVSDWIVLGVAAGAAFEAVEEVTRRIRLLTGGGSLLDSLLCPEGGVRQLKCNGATTYSLSPFSGTAGNVFPYAGHAVVTGLVAGAIGLGVALWRRGRVHRGGYRAALQILAPVVPLWTWWVAVVDHMGRNASDYVLWLQTGGEAPSWPIEVTASITGYGHGRGGILLLMLALAWIIDSRTLWGGGYVSALESDNYGNRWGPWRWRVWAGVPRNAFGRFLADGACLVSVVGVEWRWAWMTLMEAAAFREPRLLLATPAKLRIAREEAARAELDPAPEQWWRVRLAGLCAVVAGLLVIAMVPGLTRSMADSLGEGSAHWLAGLLDALGAAWESLSWEQKLGLMLFAGAMILFTGGTLGLAFEVGMGVATVFGAARGAAALMRDPRGTTARYLSTHTPAEIALDLAAAALTTVGGGAASAMGGQVARGAYAATREARYASWLWRTDRTAWRHYVRNARHRLIHDETGAASTSMWSPRNGLPAYWDDPRRVQQWFNNLPTRTNPPTTPAYQYQHRVLGTDVERHISSDAGDEIWADSVTIDRKSGITMAWDAKYTESGPKALYEGHAPKFIIKKFDAEIEKYREVINSPNNPVSQLNLVTNTPEAATYLGNRARKALGPNITLTVYVIP